MLHSQIPRQFGISTIPLCRHVTLSVTANALGNIFIAWTPYHLADNTNANTSLIVNNSAGYDGASSLGTTPFATYQTYSYTLPAGSVQTYSLVSACMFIQPQSNWSTITGKLGMASVKAPDNAGAPGSSSSYANTLAYQTFGNIELMPHYAEANLQNSESGLLRYTIADVHDLEKFTINDISDPSATSYPNETQLLAYATGCPASAKFNIELFMNYEVTCIPGSAFSGLGKPCSSMEDPTKIHMALANSSKVCQAIKGYSGIGGSINTTNMVRNQIEGSGHSPLVEQFQTFNQLREKKFVEKYGHLYQNDMENDIQHDKEVHDFMREINKG